MIDLLDVFAFVVFGILLIAGVVLVVSLGSLPGRIAHKRGHPQADAVAVAGWLGLATMGILWPLAPIWAFLTPAGAGPSPAALESADANVSTSTSRRPWRPRGASARRLVALFLVGVGVLPTLWVSGRLMPTPLPAAVLATVPAVLLLCAGGRLLASDAGSARRQQGAPVSRAAVASVVHSTARR
jgi:hypothetical protein